MTYPSPSAMLAMAERLRAMALTFTDWSYEAVQLREAAAMLRSASQPAPLSVPADLWRTMDSALKDGTPVIIAQPVIDSRQWIICEAHYIKGRRKDDRWFGTGDYGDDDFSQPYKPTHWQPLPAAPDIRSEGSPYYSDSEKVSIRQGLRDGQKKVAEAANRREGRDAPGTKEEEA